jgi:hypothetical protein
LIDVLWYQMLEASPRSAAEIVLDIGIFAMTLCCGCPAFPGRITLAEVRSYYTAYHNIVSRKAGSLHDADNAAHFFADFISLYNGRRLAHTKDRRLTVVPSFAKPGDVCCLVPGLSVPLV